MDISSLVPDGGHVIELAVAGISFWGIAWGFRREDRKLAIEKEDKAIIAAAELKRQQDTRHQENLRAMNEIATHLKYNPPHVHTEKVGTLKVDGVRYGPKA